MNPEITVYGIIVMYRPRRKKPNRIWNTPASTTTVKAIARAVPRSGIWLVKLRITAVNTTVIGPVGSEISVGVPPKREATRPMITAPHKPAAAPAPEATPKASAMGRATTAAVNPPKRSPRMLRVLMWFRNTP